MHQLDLSALAELVLAKGRHKKLGRLIRKALSIASAQKDLVDAGECLRVLNPLLARSPQPTSFPQDSGVIGGALFAHAVVLYSRATDTSTSERDKWFGIELLSDEQRPHHRELMQLRNEVVAHFGRSKAGPAGPSVRDVLVLKQAPKGNRVTQQIAFYEERAHTRAYFTRRLLELVPKVDALARERFDRIGTDILIELNRCAKDDPDFIKLLGGLEFRPENFFQSRTQAEIDQSDIGILHYVTDAAKL